MVRSAEKLFYKIGEISRICEIEPHVLRYWESEFNLLSPVKNRAGQRVYRDRDLQIIQAIKHLLYEKGYTIAGAKQKLREDGTANLPLFGGGALKTDQKKELAAIKLELQKILKILQAD